MDATRTGGRELRILTLVVVVLAALAVLGVAAPRAAAYAEWVHGDILESACETCHLDGHTSYWIPWVPASEVCVNCHLDFRRPRASLTCWSCHTPIQDMSGVRDDAACTQACHLPDGTSITHAPHADRSAACGTCHALTASLTDPNGSAHHSGMVPVAPSVTSFLPSTGVVGSVVTLTGTSFSGATAVAFGGVPAAVFTVVRDSQIRATVPAGAVSGVVAVTTVYGTGSSAASFVVVPEPAPVVTGILPAAGLVGSAVTITGSGFGGATAVGFGGTPAVVFSVVSDSQIDATVPAGAVSGAVTVTTPAGVGTSATSFTVLVRSRLTLKVLPTTLALGRSVRASGTLTPLALAGSKVRLTVQVKKGSRWVTLKAVSVATRTSGAFTWSYKPARRGAFHVRASVAASATRAAAATKWVSFRVQ